MWIKELWHKLGSPRWFYQISSPWIIGFGVAALVLLTVGVVWGLVYAPQDYQQGNSFRIMYVHVPAAMVSQSVYLGMGVAGFVLFVWRMKLADVAIAACLPFGIMLTALALFTGGVWGRPTWGTWWEWGRTDCFYPCAVVSVYRNLCVARGHLGYRASRARQCISCDGGYDQYSDHQIFCGLVEHTSSTRVDHANRQADHAA